MTIETRRSPIGGSYQATSTQVLEGMRVPLYGPTSTDGGIQLRDLSWRRRFGLKGPGAQQWLAEQGFDFPSAANSWVIADGVLVARIGTAEVLVEAMSGAEPRVMSARGQLLAPSRPLSVYPVMRQDFVAALQGDALLDLCRQICSFDFSPMLVSLGETSGSLVLTTMIGVGVLAIPRLVAGATELSLWIDPSFATYLSTTLATLVANPLGNQLVDHTSEV